ncbi:hypothetical protein [Austwickia chelonae]|uniref:hypothetical protein n=1 Tax=Austwickia chelonae TaxID=100225 RepID=UPI0012DF04A2|nr:hypothetical protein [Austwickia chelonae]
MNSGTLMAWRISHKDVRYPAWQMSDGRVLPHLRDILAALPDPNHPRSTST